MHLLLPDVISLANDPLLAYSAGLSHPTGDMPADLLAALIRETIPAVAGAEDDVPDT